MTAEELDRTLQSGIDAIKQGQRDHGRELLLKVVETDERSEQGWFWLSMALDDPQDKTVALENVLTLNPANAAARANLKLLNEHAAHESTAPAAMRTAAASPASFAPPSPVEVLGAIDNPFQCVYCGAPARESDRRRPECHRSLTTRRTKSKQMSYALRTALFEERMQCLPDKRIRGGAELNRRGRLYSRDGKWALAIAHYRAAITAMPNRAEFYEAQYATH